ncbi:GAF domain-containing protein [Paeniroseomonas aquatica]|uniref:GAF domain-containing protein n=1 Tax=Paeniroseomonas aquatica TaxID=373043 RepID=A0ABT8A6E6_9PROT|nr:GAF domain-containing protein [Paeniroseomonas aquatica]MDN3564991.1 GAF domain-containing protein [Paeniroseomonas aquatica]
MTPAPVAAEGLPRRCLGLRLAAILEILALLGAMLLLDRLALGNDRFASLSPHPFWIVVLLAAAQYGAREALFAALLATVALLAGQLPEQAFGEDLPAWLLRVSTVPVPWFVAAVLLGEIRDGHRRRAEGLAQSLAELRIQAAAITQAYELLSATRAELEARVAGQVRTVRATYAAARAIERQETEEVLIGVASLVREMLNASQFSLFLLNGQRLELAAAEGWGSGDRFSHGFDAASPLFRAVVAERRVLTTVRPGDEALLRGEGILAGPLVGGETGRVVGILKVEAIPFLELNPTTVQNFHILCDWIGSAFDKALQHERLLGTPADAPADAPAKALAP